MQNQKPLDHARRRIMENIWNQPTRMAGELMRIPSTRIGLFRMKRHDVEFSGPGFLPSTAIGDPSEFMHGLVRLRDREGLVLCAGHVSVTIRRLVHPQLE